MKIKKRLLSLVLAGTMDLGLIPGMSITALAADGDTSYPHHPVHAERC